MMKNSSNLGIECDYSFDMLYSAAFGKSMDSSERKRLQTLPQPQINALVLDWARRAQWQTERRVGLDGAEYIAFWK